MSEGSIKLTYHLHSRDPEAVIACIKAIVADRRKKVKRTHDSAQRKHHKAGLAAVLDELETITYLLDSIVLPKEGE